MIIISSNKERIGIHVVRAGLINSTVIRIHIPDVGIVSITGDISPEVYIILFISPNDTVKNLDIQNSGIQCKGINPISVISTAIFIIGNGGIDYSPARLASRRILTFYSTG